MNKRTGRSAHTPTTPTEAAAARRQTEASRSPKGGGPSAPSIPCAVLVVRGMMRTGESQTAQRSGSDKVSNEGGSRDGEVQAYGMVNGCTSDMAAFVSSTALLNQRPAPSCHQMRTCHAARHSDSTCRCSAAGSSPCAHSGQQPVPAASAAWRVALLRRAARSAAPPALRHTSRRQRHCTVTIDTGTKKGGRTSATRSGYRAQQNGQDRRCAHAG